MLTISIHKVRIDKMQHNGVLMISNKEEKNEFRKKNKIFTKYKGI